MPEIAEIARIVHFLRIHLVGRTIVNAAAIDDANVFGKVGTTGAKVAAVLTGRKVVSAGNQGKYFWIVLDKSPHLVMHFGMTGWIHIKGQRTAYTNYYNKMKPEDAKVWPPKFWKFHLKTDDPVVEVAFTDPRRFGRVRLVDCPGETIREHSPLMENGPDPVVDTDVFTVDFLKQKMKARRVPIKALLLDQAMISGIGNWVGDEVLYQAKFHPEQYCNEFNDDQIQTLYDAIRYVCQLAVDKLGDSDQFPKDWMFHYRWGKGQKGAAGHLPSGERLAFLTVGGRTSCYAPDIQKKTGHIAPGVKEEPIESDQDEQKPKKGGKAKGKTVKSEAKVVKNEPETEIGSKAKSGRGTQKRKKGVEEEEEEDVKPVKKGKARAEPTRSKPKVNGTFADRRGTKDDKNDKNDKEAKSTIATNDADVSDGRRRSGRLRR